MKRIKSFSQLFESNNTDNGSVIGKELTWEKYCQEIFNVDYLTAEVLLMEECGIIPSEILEYRKTIYFILGLLKNPEYNNEHTESIEKSAKDELEKLKKKYPDIQSSLSMEDYFDCKGNEWGVVVGMVGDGCEPVTLSWEDGLTGERIITHWNKELGKAKDESTKNIIKEILKSSEKDLKIKTLKDSGIV